MRVNADFQAWTIVRFEENEWVPSPVKGVERKMLDRIGEEVGRATTIVRFTLGSAFSAHTHDGGGEYLVLDGTFQDEDGDFPAGSYLRNLNRPGFTGGCLAQMLGCIFGFIQAFIESFLCFLWRDVSDGTV